MSRGKVNSRIRTWLAAVLVFAVVGCSSVDKPAAEGSEPRGVSRPPAVAPRTLDAQYAEVAQRVPGFGGMFYDDNGQLNAYLVKPAGLSVQALAAQRTEVKEAIQSVFGDEVFFTQQVDPLSGQLQPQRRVQTYIKVLAGTYGFMELAGWYEGVRNVLTLPGVVFTDIDETRNRLVVGVEKGNAAARTRIENALAKQNLPPGVVLIEETVPIAPAQTLVSARRPVRGGMQTDIPPNSAADKGTGECTLGFNAYSQHFGVWGFVTNSHCTNTNIVVDGVTWKTPFYQSLFIRSHYVGYEYYDPAFFQAWRFANGQTVRCPAARCRWSDSAFIRYTTNEFELGMIARPKYAHPYNQGKDPRHLELNSSNPTIRITRETSSYRMPGQYLHKVGRTTGWTYGKVLNACQDVPISGYVLLCQGLVDTGSQGGDSGSPVFEYYTDGTAKLYGILWGGNRNAPFTQMYFSPINQVEMELGALRTHR